MVGYKSVQILHDETVATGIRNGAKMVIEGGVSLHLRFLRFHDVKMVHVRACPCKQNNLFCTYLKKEVESKRVNISGDFPPVLGTHRDTRTFCVRG